MTMSERRPHWDASLISAVLADLRDVYDSGYGEEQAFRIIAAVEDWVLSAPIFDLYLSRKHAPDKAAIQRVRDLHRTGPGEPTPGGSICWGCGGTWPCPTIKALDGAT